MHHLFEHFEATLESLAESIQASAQAIRNNLKKLETLGIIENSAVKQTPRRIRQPRGEAHTVNMSC